MATPVSEREASRIGRAARGLERLVAGLARAASYVAGAACLATLALVGYAVAMRYFLNRPQSWSDEAVGWLVVVTVMLAVPEAQRRGENIGVDVLTSRLTGAGRRGVAIMRALSVAIVAAILISEGLEMVAFTRRVGIVSNALPEVGLWAIQAFVPLGGLLLLIVALSELGCHVAGVEPRGPSPGEPGAHE
ncbi:MAG: TRAP transporter small permease [Pseudomonadota bacterium]